MPSDLTLAQLTVAAFCAAAIVAGGCYILDMIKEIARHDD